MIEPDHPFVEEVAWTIPLSLVPEEGTRKDWGLRVRVVLPKNITVTTLYPMKVKWDWPEST